MPCAEVWQAERLPLAAEGAAPAFTEGLAGGADVPADCAKAADAKLNAPAAIMTRERFIRDFIGQPPLPRQSRVRTERALNEGWNLPDGNPFARSDALLEILGRQAEHGHR